MVLGRIREESENLEEIDFVLRKNNLLYRNSET